MTEIAPRILDFLRQRFQESFHSQPEVFAFAPGRVNLIGEHTDYNQGFAMPTALKLGVYVAAGHRGKGEVVVQSLNLREETVFSLNALEHGENWSDYVRGVAWALLGSGYPLEGIEAIVWGDLPMGAGLGSSAALEVAFAQAWNFLSEQNISSVALALMCQKAENEFVGVQCGIMDQLASSLGKVGHALLIDCRSLEHWYLSIPEGTVVVATHSGVHRALSSSQYNWLRQECQEAANILGASALRDVSVEQLEMSSHLLPPHLLRRARHVVTENQRVMEAANALRRGELSRFGQLMYESHRSLREDYGVSSRELDILVDIARRVPGVWGSRLTGAGFGGCTVSLASEAALELLRREVKEDYKKATGLEPQMYVSRPREGSRIVTAS